MPGDSLLRVVGLSKYFGPIKALENVSFEVKRNEILAIVGDNGAGKSTLLKILSSVLQPTSGEIYFEGKKVTFRDPQDAMRHGIAIAHQILHEQLIDKRTVWENFFAGREIVKKIGPIPILDKKAMKTHVRKLIESFNLTITEDQKVGQLSEEERQIITILKALDNKPKLLLLDESFTFLSLTRVSEILNMLKKIKEKNGCSIIFVSHDLTVVKNLSDKLLILRNGKKVFFGGSKEVTEEEVVKYIRGELDS